MSSYSPEFLPVTPASAPDPVTPAGGNSDPVAYGKVTPSGTGPAPAAYDIAAPQDDLSGLVEAAGRLSGAGVLYPSGPRQAEAHAILDSPQGVGAGEGHQNVLSGFPDYETANVSPGPDMENPIQGTGTLAGTPYPQTAQPDMPCYPAHEQGGTADAVKGGVAGMPGGKGMDYPGTVQDGLTKYGATG